MGDIGSDIAMDAADAVFVGDDVMKVPYLMTLSQKTMRTIRVNIFLSQALNAVAVVLAMTGSWGRWPARWSTMWARWQSSSAQPCC